MSSVKKITDFLDSYLKTNIYSDISFNGLQFEGKNSVKKILCAVDASIETFEYAISKRANLIIVHHGLFWKYTDPSIRGYMRDRIRILFENNISLYASHLPLDAHDVIGNNVQLIEAAGAAISGQFPIANGKFMSFTGDFKNAEKMDSIIERLNMKLNTESKVLPFGSSKIETIAVCSGSAGYAEFTNAVERGVDCFITGEEIDIYHIAKDAKLNVIFAGHHASEILGVKALAFILKKEIGVPTEFVDIPTGL